jgi:hypothetical protein
MHCAQILASGGLIVGVGSFRWQCALNGEGGFKLVHPRICMSCMIIICLRFNARSKKMNGVLQTRVGYTGGRTPNPTYEVCSCKTQA